MSQEIPDKPASKDDSGNGCIPLSKIVADAPPPRNDTRLVVQPLPDGNYRLLNGHRRYATLMSFVARGTEGFSPDMMIPVVIIAAENQLPEPMSHEVIRKMVVTLHRQGLSNAVIANLLAVPISTVERHLATMES